MLPDDIRKTIAGLGMNLTPDMMAATQKLVASHHAQPPADHRISRDLQYGPHDRHRADIFASPGTDGAPVLVYVHGGGFVMGDKRSEGTPFYDNVGHFAAASGMVGVTMTYRLAPADPWPAGAEDLAMIVAWLQDNIAAYGGDPDKIFLMGQSAGAVHVASYLAHRRFHGGGGPGIAGALMLSCIYDVEKADANQFHRAYYGEDRTQYREASTTEGLIATDVPFFATVSEFDIPDFQKQAADFVANYCSARGTYPRMHYLSGHNHLSPALTLGSDIDTLGRQLRAFVTAFC